MSRRSLRYRLLVAATVSTMLALLLAGIGLAALFENHLERRFESELTTYVNQLVGRIDADEQGRIHVHGSLADPRFQEPLSGLYWQVQDEERHTLLRSRSLWDSKIDLPRDELSLGDVHHHILPGPGGQTLMVNERQIILEPDTLARRLRVAVARDRHDLEAASSDFATGMLPYFLLLGGFLMLASWIQVSIGLAPLEFLRRGVLKIRGGQAQRLDETYPDEVMPLVDEINDLLHARDTMIERSRTWTADLAHGLKTPLSALGNDAQRLRELGQNQMADDLDELAQAMRRRVDRELIRARLRSASSVVSQHADLVRVVQRLLKTLARTPQGEAIDWLTDIPEQVTVAMRDDDLTELLGNLLDNASKWARTRVWITVVQGKDDGVSLLIEDDGPGVPEEQRVRLGQRGLRLDQQTHGHGLGLAIAHDIVSAYSSSIGFARSRHGGLAVSINFGMPVVS